MDKQEYKRKWPQKKKLLVALVAAGLLLVTGGTTLAWLSAQSAMLSNTFDPAAVTCTIDETFSDGVKSDVSIRNTGTMHAYIRAALVPVWKDGETIAAQAATLDDCTIVWGDNYGVSWIRGVDGFYYCTQPVPAGENTPVLIKTCTANTNDDFHFELQISAQAIQALPASVVKSVWDSAVSDVREGGTLEVVK